MFCGLAGPFDSVRNKLLLPFAPNLVVIADGSLMWPPNVWSITVYVASNLKLLGTKLKWIVWWVILRRSNFRNSLIFKISPTLLQLILVSLLNIYVVQKYKYQAYHFKQGMKPSQRWIPIAPYPFGYYCPNTAPSAYPTRAYKSSPRASHHSWNSISLIISD